MTLIVAIKCADGVVMASDGHVTFGAAGGRLKTIRQTADDKITIHGDGQWAMGASGYVGTAQLLRAKLDEVFHKKQLRGVKDEVAAAEILWRALGPTAAQARQWSNGEDGASCLLALPIDRKPCLMEFTGAGTPEVKTDRLPFVAIGSGQLYADSIVAFLKHMVWSEGSLPVLEEASLVAYWALRHAVQTDPGGVGEPIQLVELFSPKGKDWTTRVLRGEDLSEHDQNVLEAESLLRRHLLKGDGEEAPAPPIP